MLTTRVIILFIAIALAVLLTLFVFMPGKKKPSSPKVAPQKVPKVLVLAKSLQRGHRLKVNDLIWKTWPQRSIMPGYIVEGTRQKGDFVNTILRRSATKDQPITEQMIVRAGRAGYLASLIKPGMRAISVAVKPHSGVSGFIFPGDYVDVIAIKTRQAQAAQITTSETIAKKVLVLGIDQQGSAPKGKQAVVSKTVTLEVLPHQAEEISKAQKEGQVSLSLYSVLTPESDKSDGALFSKPVKKKESSSTVHELHGDKAEVIEVQE